MRACRRDCGPISVRLRSLPLLGPAALAIFCTGFSLAAPAAPSHQQLEPPAPPNPQPQPFSPPLLPPLSPTAACFSCPSGSVPTAATPGAPASAASCTPCPPGSYADGSPACSRCPAGTYATALGSPFCSPVPPGYFVTPNGTALGTCGPGQFLSPPAGNANDGGGACAPCAPGSVSPGSALACTACPPDSYAADGVTCAQCPAGSASAGGSTSLLACLCAYGEFPLFAKNGSIFVCTPCPDGALCDSTVALVPLALEGWWHPPGAWTHLYYCDDGMCTSELDSVRAAAASAAAEGRGSAAAPLAPAPSVVVAGSTSDPAAAVVAGYTAANCRAGHTGPVCSVCLPGWTFVGDFCGTCRPGSSFKESWSVARISGLVVGLALVFFGVTLPVMLGPLLPHGLHTHLHESAKRHATAAKRHATAAWRRIELASTRSTPRKLPSTPLEGSVQASEDPGKEDCDAAEDVDAALGWAAESEPPTPRSPGSPSPPGTTGSWRGLRWGERRGEKGDLRRARVLSRARSLVEEAVEVALFVRAPMRLMVENLQAALNPLSASQQALVFPLRPLLPPQIIGSFKRTMRLVWPNVFRTVMSRLSFLDASFTDIPAAACNFPDPSYFDVFLGITGGVSGMFVYSLVIWALGAWLLRRQGATEKKRVAFNRASLARLLFTLNLAYTPLTGTVLGMFGCRSVAGASWLRADMRVMCGTPKHLVYRNAAIFFVIVYVAGFPLFCLGLLFWYNVPQSARALKRRAYLRALVDLALQQGVLSADVDLVAADPVTISDDHAQQLYDAYLAPAERRERRRARRRARARAAALGESASGKGLGSFRPRLLSYTLSMAPLAPPPPPRKRLNREEKVEKLLAYSSARLRCGALTWHELENTPAMEGAKAAVGQFYTELHADAWARSPDFYTDFTCSDRFSQI